MAETASAAGAREIARAAKMLGVDTDALLRAHGVADADLAKPDRRVPFRLVVDLMSGAVDRGVDTFGLRLGAMGQWGLVVEYLAREGPTLGKAWERMVRYARIIVDSADVELRIDADTVTIGGVLPMERVPDLPASVMRQGVELWMSSFVSLGRAITDEPWQLREVCFSFEAPPDTGPVEQFFAAPLKYGCTRTQIVADASVLEIAVRRSDTQLARILERHCEELLAQLPDPDAVLAQVHRAIAASLPSGDTGIAAVADKLGTTARTLQRRLADAGTTHKELLEQTRRELALRYLREQKLAVSEAALLLGYSETSAFHRAFKRWTGKTPRDYRQTAL